MEYKEKIMSGSKTGNLSIQITKLKEAGYIDVTKKFRNNYLQTLCRITALGKQKFIAYVNDLGEYLNPDKSGT